MLFGKGPYCLSGPNCQENLFRNDSNLAETPRINIRITKYMILQKHFQLIRLFNIRFVKFIKNTTILQTYIAVVVAGRIGSRYAFRDGW